MRFFAAPLAIVVLIFALAATPANLSALQVVVPATVPWPKGLPVYDHVVIVMEENKNYDQIIGNRNAPYINDVLRKEGASLTQMYAEEHHSEGNYFFLFSGSDQKVGYMDVVPHSSINASNLGSELIRTGHSFKGYSESLPETGSVVERRGYYARKHNPWISFANLPDGKSPDDSSNLRFPQDFPTDYNKLPTVAFVIPNLADDMHDGKLNATIAAGDHWLKKNLDGYYQWAKQHNSLLIVTWDESDEFTMRGGLTDPADKNPLKRNQIATILAGAHIKAGEYPEGKGVTHVNILRTLEAMYKLSRSGGQQWNALKADIPDDYLLQDIFDVRPSIP